MPTSANTEHFLSRVDAMIDWTEFDQAAPRGPVDNLSPVPRFALKIALVKHWYGLTDQLAQFDLLDRLSFLEFIGFIGDGSANDLGILNELNNCAWASRPAMQGAMAGIERQLREQGFVVRCGEVREPSLMPCTETGLRAAEAGAAARTQPGELGRMMEAVTAKAFGDGVTPMVPQGLPPSAEEGEPVSSELAPLPATGTPDQPATRAILEWPWGETSELTGHLNVGRDYAFSPLARELTPFTHVSRRHAELLVYGDSVWIRDLGSRNGTYVNGEQVPTGQAYLIDSDSTIRFGPLLSVSLKITG
jgi:hypothetical protein